MSKYTTELRYICEHESGLEESKGYNDVEEIIENARTKIFNFSYPIYDESYKPILETKILYHYYTREIGLETYGLWKLKLNTKLNEIMPYYNQLYRSALLEFNPLWTEDIQTEHTRGTDGTSLNVADKQSDSSTSNINVGDRNKKGNENNSNLNASEGTVHSDETSRDKYADTPQGALTDLEDDKYLTNARKITDEIDSLTRNQNTSVGAKENTEKEETTNTNIGNNVFKENSQNNNVFSNIEEYLEKVQGRRGKDASELLLKYRKTFLNIDMQVIDELEELFMHLW